MFVDMYVLILNFVKYRNVILLYEVMGCHCNSMNYMMKYSDGGN